MDPDNLLRGPRRALRRGEAAARLPRVDDGPTFRGVDFDEPIGPFNGMQTSRGVGEGSREAHDDIMTQRRTQEELWAQQVAEDGSDISQMASDGGAGSDSDGMTDHYGEIADEDLMDGPHEDFDLGSQQDMHNEDQMISFDPMLLGLKEINNLAHFSVSSHKPGNGVEELLSDDLDKYWQSDGPQPHLLTIHFLRRVEIRAIRFFVDYNQDESYTPTLVILSAGTGHHDLIEFSTLALQNPSGWQEVDLSSAGGGEDGQSLCCWIVQAKIKENHQNGKDTHIRGIKLYAIDENAPPADSALDELEKIKERTLQHLKEDLTDRGDYLFERIIAQSPDRLPGVPERSGSIAKFMRDPEIR